MPNEPFHVPKPKNPAWRTSAEQAQVQVRSLAVGIEAMVQAFSTFGDAMTQCARDLAAATDRLAVQARRDKLIDTALARYFCHRRQHIAKARGKNWRSVR